MLNVRELEAFRAFIECGSVTAAAERLRRTQPQVGRLLVALEQSVGFALFVRSGKRLVATPEGWRFYEEADRVIRELQSLSRTAEKIRLGASDHLRVLSAPQVTRAMISGALVQVVKALPTLTAEIASRARLDIETWITQEQFDLGVTVLPLDNSAVEVEPFLRVPAVIVMSSSHPLAANEQISVAEFIASPLIVTHSRSMLRTAVDRIFRENDTQADIRFEASTGLLACELASRDLGIALADPFVALSAAVPGLTIKPFEQTVPLDYGFFYPVGARRSIATNLLADAIREAARVSLAEYGLPSTSL